MRIKPWRSLYDTKYDTHIILVCLNSILCPIWPKFWVRDMIKCDFKCLMHENDDSLFLIHVIIMIL